MKTTKSLKTVAFALGLAAMGLTAGNLNAQTGGGLFRKGAETEAGASNGIYMRDTGGTGTGFLISTEQFGGNVEPGPVYFASVVVVSKKPHEFIEETATSEQSSRAIRFLRRSVCRRQHSCRQCHRKHDGFQRFGCFHLIEI